ncbi:MAG: hypothetical protein ACYDHA_11560 [Bellilinea sp.]
MKIGISIFCLIFLLARCVERPPTIDQPPILPSPSGIRETAVPNEKTEIGSVRPTQSPSPSSRSQSSTSLRFLDVFSITPIPQDGNIEVNCISESTPPEIDSDANGIIPILERVNSRDGLLLDLQTGNASILNKGEKDVLTAFSVSTDRKWLSYETIIKNDKGQIISKNVTITSASEQIGEIPINDQWYSPHWVNNDELLFTLAEPDTESPGYDRYPPALILFNPFSGQTQKLEPDFPDILSLDPSMQWGLDGLTVYDPTMKRVVYGYGTSKEGSSYRIWDMQANNLIATISSGEWLPGAPPIWSNDGSKFALNLDVNGSELYSISREGEKEQLTNFKSYLRPGYTISHYVWSPNNNSLAFYIQPYDAISKQWGEYTLVLYDFSSRKTIFTCVYSDYGGKAIGQFSGDPQPPIWSPDGSMLLIEQRHELEKSRLLLINLNKNQLYNLGENLQPFGWLSSTPENISP